MGRGLLVAMLVMVWAPPSWAQKALPAIDLRMPAMKKVTGARALLKAGLALERKGDRKAAAAKYRAALALDPGLIRARYNLASVHAALKNHARAVAILGQLKRSDCLACTGYLIYSRTDKDWNALRSHAGYRALTAKAELPKVSVGVAAAAIADYARSGKPSRLARQLIHPRLTMRSVSNSHMTKPTVTYLIGRRNVRSWMRKQADEMVDEGGDLHVGTVRACTSTCCMLTSARSDTLADLSRVCFGKTAGGAPYVRILYWGSGP